jgi:hypothetical protein
LISGSLAKLIRAAVLVEYFDPTLHWGCPVWLNHGQYLAVWSSSNQSLWRIVTAGGFFWDRSPSVFIGPLRILVVRQFKRRFFPARAEIESWPNPP